MGTCRDTGSRNSNNMWVPFVMEIAETVILYLYLS